MLQRRTVVVDGALRRPGTHESVEVTRFKAMGVCRHGGEIANGIAAGTSSEHIREAQCCQGGESPGAAPFDRHLIGMGVSRGNQCLCSGCAVDHINDAPALVQSFPVSTSETGGPAVIHIHDTPAAGGPVLNGQAEAAAGHGCRTAVAFHQKGCGSIPSSHGRVIPGMGALLLVSFEPERLRHADLLSRQRRWYGRRMAPGHRPGSKVELEEPSHAAAVARDGNSPAMTGL